MPSEPVVELHGLTKRYAGHVAVSDLSLRVPRGVVYGLLGPNGAGKTTTIRMINDIVRPDEGTITLFGSVPPGPRAQERIGYLPEERGLYAKMTVRRVLTFLAELRGVSRAESATRIPKWIERLELGAWVDKKVEALSKGMQQKVQFIGTVLHEPDLLILDEPFSGLDPINADVLREIVAEQKKANRTILFSTHLMEHAEQLCDALCIIAHSKRILEGELSSIKKRAREARNAYKVEVAGGERAYEVALGPGEKPSDLLKKLLDDGKEVVRFEQSVPTLHEIFVEEVQRVEEAAS
jgi:ABC-2 type transport system ATP-binding protein